MDRVEPLFPQSHDCHRIDGRRVLSATKASDYAGAAALIRSFIEADFLLENRG